MKNPLGRNPCLFPAALLLAATGCGGGSFGSELAVRPSPLDIKRADESTIRIPADHKFSIALAPAQHAAGLDGVASADSHASRDGTADASAKVERGGKGDAGFQLGHGFRNDTDRQLDLSLRVKYAYDFAIEIAQGPAKGATGLNFYARNHRGLLLRSLVLLTQSLEEGATSRSGQDAASLVITLAPGDSVDVYLAGQALVDVADGRSASCRIRVSDVQLEAAVRPAPVVQPAADAQP